MEHRDDFIMLPKIDFAFKELMTNEYVRKGFLSAVLDIKDTDIKSTEMLNTNLRKEHEDEKQGVLDVRLLMNDSTELDIEIQLTYMMSWADRSTFYMCRMISGQTGINKLYTNMKKCVAINILDFKYIDNTDKFHTVFHVREDDENIIFTDKMEWHIIELPKLPVNTDGTSLYDWARFIRSEKREEFEMLAKRSDYLNEAFRQLEVISQDKLKQIEYTSRMKAVMDHNTMMAESYERGEKSGFAKGEKLGLAKGEKLGFAKGEEAGIAKGKNEAVQEIIAQLRAEGFSDEIISKISENMSRQ